MRSTVFASARSIFGVFLALATGASGCVVDDGSAVALREDAIADGTTDVVVDTTGTVVDTLREWRRDATVAIVGGCATLDRPHRRAAEWEFRRP